MQAASKATSIEGSACRRSVRTVRVAEYKIRYSNSWEGARPSIYDLSMPLISGPVSREYRHPSSVAGYGVTKSSLNPCCHCHSRFGR